VLLLLCRCLAGKQRHKEAEMACRKAIAAHPHNPAASLQLAAVLQHTGRHQDAVETIRHGQDHLTDMGSASCQVGFANQPNHYLHAY